MRPNFLIAKTIADANLVKRMFPWTYPWHVMTPRNKSERGWTIGQYMWTSEAKQLPARVRWDLRMRLSECIDDHSQEKPFPLSPEGW